MGWKEISNHEMYCGFMWVQHVSLFDIFAWDDDPNWHVADGWLNHQADHIYKYIYYPVTQAHRKLSMRLFYWRDQGSKIPNASGPRCEDI